MSNVTFHLSNGKTMSVSANNREMREIKEALREGARLYEFNNAIINASHVVYVEVSE